MRAVEAFIQIKCEPARAIKAFLDEKDLKEWWGVHRCLVEQKQNGAWTTAWEISESGIKYISSGIIAAYDPNVHLVITNLVYLNPDREILGPMKLEIVASKNDDDGTNLQLIQSGYQIGGDWDWYYDAVKAAWPFALGLLKKYLEKAPA